MNAKMLVFKYFILIIIYFSLCDMQGVINLSLPDFCNSVSPATITVDDSESLLCYGILIGKSNKTRKYNLPSYNVDGQPRSCLTFDLKIYKPVGSIINTPHFLSFDPEYKHFEVDHSKLSVIDVG